MLSEGVVSGELPELLKEIETSDETDMRIQMSA